MAAARAGRVERLYVEKGRESRLRDLLALVDESAVRSIDDVRSVADTDSPQGVVAECTPLRPVALESMAGENAAVLILDHVEDPHNVGAAARSALAAGATGLVVSARRAAPLSAAAFKAAAGALEQLPVAIVGSIPEAVRRLKDLGLWIVGLDSNGGQTLFGLDLLTEPVAMVIGAEGSGLAELTSKCCDLVVSIPIANGVESLNASVSAALALFEIMRVRRPR